MSWMTRYHILSLGTFCFLLLILDFNAGWLITSLATYTLRSLLTVSLTKLKTSLLVTQQSFSLSIPYRSFCRLCLQWFSHPLLHIVKEIFIINMIAPEHPSFSFADHDDCIADPCSELLPLSLTAPISVGGRVHHLTCVTSRNRPRELRPELRPVWLCSIRLQTAFNSHKTESRSFITIQQCNSLQTQTIPSSILEVTIGPVTKAAYLSTRSATHQYPLGTKLRP